jgi:DNA-binding CsgD family transcriptional regulator
MKAAAAKAYIRLLCSLGLGAQSVFPELLRALAAVVPSSFRLFAGVGPDFAAQTLVFETPMPSVVEIMQKGGSCFRGSYVQFQRWWQRQIEPIHAVDPREIGGPEFFRSALYQELWRPSGCHHTLQACVGDARPLGILQLYRAVHERPFQRRESAELAPLLPHIIHGFHQRPQAGDGFAGSGSGAHVILDGSGRVSHRSAGAGELLYLLTDPHARVVSPGLPLAVFWKRLLANLSAAAAGREAPPAVLIHRNPWGRFVFRAYWLEGVNAGGSAFVLVSIEHQEPKRLRMLRTLRECPLSAREREVCFWLAQGDSLPTVARRLHIRAATAKKYADLGYMKLDVRNRTELVAMLSRGEADDTLGKKPVWTTA